MTDDTILSDDEFYEHINTSDSAVIKSSNLGPKRLQVYESGKLTVVGFGGQDVPEDYNVAEYREEIVELIRQHECTEFAFDLTGVRIISSGILGLIASVQNEGVKVAVINPSKDVREVFEVTQLDRFVELRDVEL